MATVLGKLPCLLFALHRESMYFRRAFRPCGERLDAPCWARLCIGGQGRGVVLLETGIGPGCFERIFVWLQSHPTVGHVSFEPASLIFAGFAGALRTDLSVGDVLWASEVVDQHGKATPVPWRGPTSSHLASGRLVTMPRLIATPDEKRALAWQYGAVAVDMESADFARRCTELGFPFACVRAISDDADTALSPELVTLMADGNVSPWRFAAALVRRPRLLGEMLRLARDTRHAARQLGSALVELLK